MPHRKSALAARLIELRRLRGLSQLELAQVSGVGRSTVERLERGERCSVESLRALAHGLGVPPDSLFELREPGPERLPSLRTAEELAALLDGARAHLLTHEAPADAEERAVLARLASDVKDLLDVGHLLGPVERDQVRDALREHLEALAGQGWSLFGEAVEHPRHGRALRLHAARLASPDVRPHPLVAQALQEARRTAAKGRSRERAALH